MANERRLIDGRELLRYITKMEQLALIRAYDTPANSPCYQRHHAQYTERMEFRKMLENAPAVNAVELPEGKPGDYLEWDNGTGFRQFYAIDSIMICRDCVRYALDNMAPVINHKNIVRILKEPEMREILKEKWANADNKQQQTNFSEERRCEDADD